jgi:hypothetical protein
LPLALQINEHLVGMVGIAGGDGFCWGDEAWGSGSEMAGSSSVVLLVFLVVGIG